MELEERALRRDRSFLYRLAGGLLLAIAVGAVLWWKLTDPGIGGCAASGFGSVTGTQNGGASTDAH